MRFLLRAAFAGLLLVCLAGCRPEKVWVNQAENSWYKIIKQRYRGPFVLTQVTVNPEARQLHTAGISLRFSCELSQLNRLLLRDEADLDVESYLFSALLLHANGEPLEAVSQAQLKQETVFRIGAYTAPGFFFPYRNMPAAAGPQELLLQIQGFAQKRGRKTETKPSLTLHVAVGFSQPEVLTARIVVEDFALNTEAADPHSFDFRMAGSGYPDLSWRLFAGTEVVHTGKVAKNSTTYSLPDSTPAFPFIATDSVRLQFYDDDELSDHDLLATWTGMPVRLPTQTGEKLAFPESTPNLLKHASVWCRLLPEKQALPNPKNK